MKILANDYLANLPEYGWPITGGPANLARSFYPLLAKGHEWVSVAHRYADGSVGAEFRGTFGGARWWLISFPKSYLRRRFSNRYRPVKSVERAGRELIGAWEKIIKTEEPDLVFINGISAFVWALLIAARRQGVPIVVQHAGIWTKEVSVYTDRFSKEGMKVIKRMEKDFAELSTRNIFLNKMSARAFNDLVEFVPLAHRRIIPLPCAKLPERPPSTLIKRSRVANTKIGMVARWDRIKNHEAFLGMAKEARRRGLDWKFFAVTLIPVSNYNRKLKQDYAEHVKVLPHMGQAELRKFYQSMDLLILPSRFDVSPGVVIEAAMENVPTAISPEVGYADTFRASGAGNFVINFSNPVRALKSVEKIVGKNYPRRLIKKLHQDHNPNKIVRQYAKVFAEVVK